MSDKQKFSHKDISKSEFRSVKMTGARGNRGFEQVNR